MPNLRAKLSRTVWLSAALAITVLGSPAGGEGTIRRQARTQSAAVARSVKYGDLARQPQEWLARQGLTPENFAAYVAEIDRETQQREVHGEYEHLIYYALQSQRFTQLARVEPALSAYEFVHQLDAAERARFLADGTDYLPPANRLPPPAAARLREFINVLSGTAPHQRTPDARMSYFRRFTRSLPEGQLFNRLYAEYARAMKFLYRKEFASREARAGQAADYVATLYQQRGHSTDTQVEANFAVFQALAVIKAQAPTAQLNRVLIVGPGMDFAPRTGLVDYFEPQSYQPFAIADALLGLRLADGDRLSIHCVDINDRVIAYLQGIAAGQGATLALMTGFPDLPGRPLATEYKAYFAALGRQIGAEAELPVPSALAAHPHKAVRVKAGVAACLSASRLNVITERLVPSPQYDLVVVTNVFPYFDEKQLLLAASNLAAMMKEGGYLLHNEPRGELKAFTEALGVPLEQSRTVLIVDDAKTQLFDGVAIHRKLHP